MKKWKRIIAAMLTLAMLLSVMPIGVFAEEVPEEPAPTEATEVVTEATEPATEATEEVTEATEPATEATEPATEATEAVTEATEEATEATEETTEPTKEHMVSLFSTGGSQNSGTLSSGQSWTLDEDGTLTISGEGVICDFSGDQPWDKTAVKNLVIEEGITGIGMLAFQDHTALTTATLPASLTSIGASAFLSCEQLATVNTPASFTNECVIGAAAFNSCAALKTITLPEGVVSIGNYVFVNSGLTSISWPVSLVTAMGVFDNVTSLTINYAGTKSQWYQIQFDIMDTWYYDGTVVINCALDYTCGKNLTWKLVEGTLTISGTGTMDDFDNGLAPWDDVKESIKAVVIEEGATSIGDNAFSEHPNLTTVTVPLSVETVGDYVFSGCNKLTTINYAGTKSQWDALVASVGYTNDSLLGATINCAPGGQCGQNLAWKLVNGVLTISGTGDMTNYASYGNVAPWMSLTVTSVVVEEGVTSIGDYAFMFCQAQSISLPNGLKRIGNHAFDQCKMKAVTLPETLETIGEDAFYRCAKLGSITIPASVTTIGNNAFYSCYALTTVTLPATVTNRGQNIFGYCIQLTNATVYGDVPVSAFHSCGKLSTVTLKDDPTSIGSHAFYGCKELKSISIPSTVTTIDTNAFQESGLTSVEIPANADVGYCAFYNCGDLTNVTFGSNISLDSEAFGMCTGLSQVTLPGDTRKVGDNALSRVGKVIFQGTKAQWEEIASVNAAPNAYLVCNDYDETVTGKIYWCTSTITAKFLDGTLTISGTGAMPDNDSGGDTPWNARQDITSVVVEEGITRVGKNAFEWNRNAMTLTLPSTIESMGNPRFYNLTAIYYNGTRQMRDEIVFDSESLKNKNWKYLSCGAGLSWKMEGNVLTISGNGAIADFESASDTPWFDSSDNIQHVVIGEGVTFIGTNAFWVCNSIRSMTLPSTLTSVGAHAVTSDYLKVIYYSGTQAQWDQIQIGEKNLSLTNAVLAIVPEHDQEFICGNDAKAFLKGGTLTILGAGEMNKSSSTKWPWDAYKTQITNVVIGKGITRVDSEAFWNCSNLTSVTLPEGLKQIGQIAFHQCGKLTSITIPSTVNNIGSGAFGCTGLTEITIPEGVEYIAASVFADCGSLTKVTLPASVESVEDYAFEACSALQEVHFGGTKAQWDEIWICDGNTYLLDAYLVCTDYDDRGAPKPKAWTNGFTYTYDNGTLTIYGKGEMPETYYTSGFPWSDLSSQITKVVIGEGVTSVAYRAFMWYDALTSVELPTTMEKICGSAFYACDNLGNVTFPEGLKTIESAAFSSCDSMTELNLPSTLKTIADQAFYYCVGLTSVTIPDNGVTIGAAAFQIGNDTCAIHVPGSVTAIGSSAMAGCGTVFFDGTRAQWDAVATRALGLTKLVCTDYDERVTPRVYSCGENVTAVLEGSTLTIRGTGPMADSYDWNELMRNGLSEVVIEEGVTSIGPTAFQFGYTLGTVTIPASVTEIGDNAFYGCWHINHVYYYGSAEQWEAITIGSSNDALIRAEIHFCGRGTCGTGVSWELKDGVLVISGDGPIESTPWADRAGEITSVVIRPGVTQIPEDAFAGCTKLESVNIPTSVTGIGSNAFADCDQLSIVRYPGTESQWEQISIGSGNGTLETKIAFGFKPAIELPLDYLMVEIGVGIFIPVICNDPSLESRIVWSLEDPDSDVVSLNGNEITAEKVGTAYVVASVDGVSCRCRLDVIDSSQQIGKVHLGTPAVTTELFSTNYARIDVIAELEQNLTRTMSANSTQYPPQAWNLTLSSARFADDELAEYFDLIPAGDRTLQIVPKMYALFGNGAEVKKSYSSQIIVTFYDNDEEYTTDTALKLTVKKTTPKLKAGKVDLNAFFTGDSKPIEITGATVLGVEGYDLPDWLALEDGCFKLQGSETGKATAKVDLMVDTAEWITPQKVTVNVTRSYTAPKLKLTPASAAFPAGEGYQSAAGVEMQLVSGNKKVALESLNITGITAPDGFEIRDFDPASGKFVLAATKAVTAKSIDLKVAFAQTSETVMLKVKVSAQTVKPKLSATSLKLNKAIGDMGVVTLTSQIPGYAFDEPTCTILRNKTSVPGELDISWEDGKLLVRTNDSTVYGGSYQVQIQVKEPVKPLTLKITIPAQAKSTVKVKLAAKGKLDVTRDSSSVVVTPKFTNYNGIADLDLAMTVQSVSKVKGDTWEDSQEFTVTANKDGTYTVSKVPGAAPDLTRKYRVVMTMYGVEIGSANLSLVSGKAKFTANANAVLYKIDRNSRTDLMLTTADTTLNVIDRVEFKDAKLAGIYQIYSYGNGEFAIGFLDNQVSTAAKTGKVTLNLFAEGNASAKPNATVTVNLQVR